jgi:uncharacterized protein YyaL (SSP411 family)
LKSSYFDTEEGAQDILFWMRDDHDGAELSANSVVPMNLTWLARILNVKEFQLAAARLIGSLHPVLQRAPAALPQMLAAMDATITEPIQIVIAGRRTSAAELLKVVAQSYQPGQIVLLADGAKTGSSLPT